ncbi:MAG TPA: lipid-A-disaccharide synthase N-terminal domain-containing protein [Kiritimatiellia bacterium]|nr:lipid-A-disaccharide synthase N-terminal domain-containing protein [Kiritimatiellia bacterium]HRZ13442.1 lipid-A-disaccharide synthase N-terminal domain-containing protein [Kiritimatiellia bacterium]HSA18918.1 lipid-A-disaccharide synthase N-terminal domain-containing protein [Kiritimatiellia bacterium]
MSSYISELAQPMVIVGYLGQALFFSRFLVQWIASERLKRSIVPVVFWYLSLGGGALLLAYALWRKDQVIVLGQLVGVFVYVRNLMLIRRHKEPAIPVQPA